ncbi:MAG: phosphate ABC transporter substrate-binding protein PstS [Dehalococcoidia bacterium]|nr:MAG: phosphate ABC transporter substrate-binding protein PstS [Dehalococcoidia bacterium]
MGTGTRWKRRLAFALVATSVVTLAACGDSKNEAPATATASGTATAPSKGTATTPGTIAADIGKADKADLTGAGATFPAPVYQAWFADYAKVAKGVKVNYQGVGSGGGIQQFTEKTVDFGATDLAMTDAEMAKAPDAQHIPTVLGSVVITYNLSGVTSALKFDGGTIAKIWLGKITKWNDPAIAALNPGVKLPDAKIEVVSRSDSSGTSGVFTDYLSSISPDWKSAIGVQKAPKWPVGQAGKGNDGVTNAVKQTVNSIGYVELNYAKANKLPFADVKNKAGKFVTPTIESTSAAAAGVTLPDDYRGSIVNADGDTAYPIASFTYLLVRKDASSCAKAAPLVRMLWWISHDTAAAATAKSLDYAPLPEKVLPKLETTLKSLKCEGKAILPQ